MLIRMPYADERPAGRSSRPPAPAGWARMSSTTTTHGMHDACADGAGGRHRALPRAIIWRISGILHAARRAPLHSWMEGGSVIAS